MNNNDKKSNRNKKGLVDPNKIKEYPVYNETTLLPFLYSVMEKVQSKKNIKRILSNHQVSVNGVPVSQFDFAIFPEDVVIVSQNRIAKRQSKDLPIIFEDDDIIAIDKPSGLLSVPSDREKGRTAYRLVNDYWAAKTNKGRVFVVHRLDEDTSGVLIFAKNYEIREAFQIGWASLVGKRGYYAIVEGEDIADEGTLSDYLAPDNFNMMHVTRDKSRGKLCITHFRKIAAKDGFALLDIDISTGRKNQIRVQLGNIGHYVVGDDKYGEPLDPLRRLGLHAYELILTNPMTGVVYDLKAPIPKDFKKMFFVTREETRENLAKEKEEKQSKKKRNRSTEEDVPSTQKKTSKRTGKINNAKAHRKHLGK